MAPATPATPLRGLADLLRAPLAFPLAALLLAALVHAPHLHNAFAWDDHGFLEENPAVNGSGPWRDALTRDAWYAHADDQATRQPYYRPLFVVACRLLWAAGGGAPLAFHLAAAALLLANALLARRLLARLGVPPGTAAAAALLFLVHPLGGEVGFWASAIGEPLLLLGLQATLLGLATAREAPPGQAWRGRALALAGAALALGVKETGVVVPLLAVAEALPGPPAGRWARLRATWPAWLPLPALLAARLAFVEGGGLHLAVDDLPRRLGRAGDVLGWDLARLAWPFPLSPGHQLPEAPGTSLSGLLLLALLAAAALLVARRAPRALPFAAWLVLPLLPPLVQGFVDRPTGQPVAERYLFLSVLPAMAGLCLGAAWAARRLAPAAAGAVLPGAAVAAALGLGLATRASGRAYDGDEAYYARILAVDPGDPSALHARGRAALAAGRLDEAVRWLSASVAREPRRAIARLNLALAWSRLGRPEQALVEVRAAVALDARLVPAQRLAAALLRDLGRLDEAGPHFQAAAELAPRDPAAWLDLGTWRWVRGDAAGALAAWEAGLALDPAGCELLFDAGMARRAAGRAAEAAAALRAFTARCGDAFPAQRDQAQAWLGG